MKSKQELRKLIQLAQVSLESGELDARALIVVGTFRYTLLWITGELENVRTGGRTFFEGMVRSLWELGDELGDGETERVDPEPPDS